MLLSFVAVSQTAGRSSPSRHTFPPSRVKSIGKIHAPNHPVQGFSGQRCILTLARPAKVPNALATSTDVKPYTLRNTHSVE
jgi:hypothetical protein